jgi:predicted TIM-barrel fold metal-dependent hydrolase
MIIDIHVHLGWDFTFDENFPKEALIEKMSTLNVDVQIVQPGTCHDLSTVKEQHNAIAELCNSFPSHFFGMANPSPHLSSEAYQDEISRCVEDLGFTSIKLHPMASGVNPNSKSGRKAFNAAQKYGIPVLVHTGPGFPFADPVNLVQLAKEFSEVKIIMAHCGGLVFAGNAARALASCPNIYGDTSWTPGYLIKDWIRDYGPRLMFASDHADNTETELAKIKTVGLTEEEQKSILETTALEVFPLEDKLSGLQR